MEPKTYELEGQAYTGCNCDDFKVGEVSIGDLLWPYEIKQTKIRVTITIEEVQ